MKGALLMKDSASGRASTCEILGAPDLAAVKAVGTSLKDWTCAEILAANFTLTEKLNLQGAGYGTTYKSVHTKAIMVFIDHDAGPGESPSIVLRWPAPRELMFFSHDGKYYVLKEHGDAFATVLSTFLGREIEFDHGYLK